MVPGKKEANIAIYRAEFLNSRNSPKGLYRGKSLPRSYALLLLGGLSPQSFMLLMTQAQEGLDNTQILLIHIDVTRL